MINQSPLNSGLGLAETIREIGSEKVVVAVDAANVQFWEAGLDGKRPSGRFSFTKLAEYLAKIEAVKKKFLFTARYSFNAVFIERIIELVEDVGPAFLQRAIVDKKTSETYDYNGVIYDVELLMIVVNELIEQNKINDLRQSIAEQVYYVTNQVRSNKTLAKREKQGYQLITTDYLVHKNPIAKMQLIGNLAKQTVQIADYNESGAFNDVDVEISYPEEKGVASLRKSLELAADKLGEMSFKNDLPEFAPLVQKIRSMIEQVDNIGEELARRDKDIEALEKISERKSHKVREILQIANNSANTFISKGNVDSFLVAALMDRKVMDAADTFVVLSGDGDFRLMYEKMREAHKKIVVVSPLEYLNKKLEGMILDGDISLVNPNQDGVLWRSCKSK
ncbi:MAG: NYN domain-containing protein [Candidatus Altimarinota bacterium]